MGCGCNKKRKSGRKRTLNNSKASARKRNIKKLPIISSNKKRIIVKK